MKHLILFTSAVFFTISAYGQKSSVVTAPQPLPVNDSRPKIFLAGSIDMGQAVNWQAEVEKKLQDEAVLILNPRRNDWQDDWLPVSSNPYFREQVEWELEALEQADIIIMYFAPDSKSPITLLELGLYARKGNVMMVCPEGFWRKGNVDITAERYNIAQYETINELLDAVREKIN